MLTAAAKQTPCFGSDDGDTSDAFMALLLCEFLDRCEGHVPVSQNPVDNLRELSEGVSSSGVRAQVVYHWAKGMPFREICQLTDVQEGSIVRAIVRLDETCREVKDAAKVMGNTGLVAQIEAASAAIKRDVIFAASLYIT
jgi:replicative superfamily II helicase